MTDPAWGLAPRAGAGDVPSRADVLVVGGGITGVSLLYHLREVGAVLVERDRLAAGASGRNAGFIVQGVGHNYAEAVRTYGRSRARDTWAFSVETHDLLEDALAGRSPHHRRRGHATVPVDDGERRALEESAALMADDGFEARWEGGQLLFPGDGEHNPTETVCALASFAAPGAVRDGVDVTAIEPSGGEVRVAFGERGECRAGVVVLATNAYTSRLLPEAGIAPNRAQMAATAPESRTIVTRPTGRNYGFQYWNQLWDGRVAAGGYRDVAIEEERTDDAVPTPRLQACLDAHLREWGVTAPVTHRWAGIMGFTSDGLPVVCELRPNVWVCGGYNGSGMSFAFHCARRLAEHLTGRRPAPLVPWAE